MRKRDFLFVFFFLCLFSRMEGLSQSAGTRKNVQQGKPVPAGFCVDDKVMRIYGKVSEYRKNKNLSPIPLSRSLSYVAWIHLKDLVRNHRMDGDCNFHSWSNKGNWKPICYPRDENKKNSVWDKPRELTTYPGKGYEIIYWENNPLVLDTIVKVWKTEEYFNNFLLNEGKWAGITWNAIGIAVTENYACAWFGEDKDPEGDPLICGKTVQQSPKGTPEAAQAKTITEPEKPRQVDQKAKEPSAPAKVTKPAAPVQNPETKGRPVDGKEETADKMKMSQPASVPDTTPVFFIIVRTNITRKEADKLVEKLKADAYPDAQYSNSKGKSRVSVYMSKDRLDALARLKEVKKTFKDAWLLKISGKQ